MKINDLIKALRSKTSRDNRELLDDAADAIELLYRMRDKEALAEEFKRRRGERTVEDACPYAGTWIPTSERVPQRTGEYIVMIEDFSVATSLYYDAAARVWIDRLDEDPAYYRVTHWMEMPSASGVQSESISREHENDEGFAEKDVVKGLECCRTENGGCCDECPYWGRRYVPGSGGCSNQLVNDALELINKLMEERK